LLIIAYEVESDEFRMEMLASMKTSAVGKTAVCY
jgi:hypothetical protein